MKKTIWYISKYTSPLKYGHGSRNCYLAQEFNRLGHRTIIIASDSSHLAAIPRPRSLYAREEIDGVETWWIRTLKYQRTASIRRVLSWIDFEIKLWLMPKARLPRPDVVIASSLSLLSVLNGYWLHKRYGCRLLFEIRDIWPLTLTAEGGFSRWHPLTLFLGFVERFGYRSADVVVGTMPNLAAHVEAVAGRGIRCACIPIGYDPSAYREIQPLPEGYREQYIPKGKFIVGYAGSVGRTNGLETLLDCASRMRDNARVHFVVVGEGDCLSEYKAACAALPNITFAPKLRKSQVQSFLSLCDVLYCAAKKSEVWRYGQSWNKLIDYMYSGRPVISSYSGFPSMLDEAGCGVFVEAEDASALMAAVENYARLSADALGAVGQKGKMWLAAHRRYETLANNYVRLFDAASDQADPAAHSACAGGVASTR